MAGELEGKVAAVTDDPVSDRRRPPPGAQHRSPAAPGVCRRAARRAQHPAADRPALLPRLP